MSRFSLVVQLLALAMLILVTQAHFLIHLSSARHFLAVYSAQATLRWLLQVVRGLSLCHRSQTSKAQSQPIARTG